MLYLSIRCQMTRRPSRPVGRQNSQMLLDGQTVLQVSVLVGRGGLEPPTSRLSGVRSNHLSYRPNEVEVRDFSGGAHHA